MDEKMNGRMIQQMSEWMDGCKNGRMGGRVNLPLPQNPSLDKKLSLTDKAPLTTDRLGHDGESQRQ